jgi:hypothetical protein
MVTPQSLIDGIQEQGRKMYRALWEEIARMEQRLEGLRRQTSLWREALTGEAEPRRKRTKSSVRRRAAKRVSTRSSRSTAAKHPKARERSLEHRARRKRTKKLGKVAQRRAPARGA